MENYLRHVKFERERERGLMWVIGVRSMRLCPIRQNTEERIKEAKSMDEMRGCGTLLFAFHCITCRFWILVVFTLLSFLTNVV